MTAASDRPLIAKMPPNRLCIHLRSRCLEVGWPDGASDWLDFDLLRQQCPCAECRHGRRLRLPHLEPGRADVVDAVASGSNAVQLIFSDGHARGIFPFAYLHALAEGRPRL